MKKLELKIKGNDGTLTQVQIRSALSSEDYFTYLGLTSPSRVYKPEEVTAEVVKKNQVSQYFLIEAMVINPGNFTEEKIRKMPFRDQRKLYDLISKHCFPNDDEDKEEQEKKDPFLEAEGPQDGS